MVRSNDGVSVDDWGLADETRLDPTVSIPARESGASYAGTTHAGSRWRTTPAAGQRAETVGIEIPATIMVMSAKSKSTRQKEHRLPIPIDAWQAGFWHRIPPIVKR